MACLHEKLSFGSGDYYLFCDDCRCSWVMRVEQALQPGELVEGIDHNQGEASGLSGERRVR